MSGVDLLWCDLPGKADVVLASMLIKKFAGHPVDNALRSTEVEC